MNRYGQSITWGPLTAPQLFTGDVVSYSYRDAVTAQDLEDPSGDIPAIALHSQKAELNFESEVTNESTNFLDLSAGAALVVSGISSGTVLVRKAVEKWSLQKRKSATIQATHYHDLSQSSPVLAGTSLSAFTPDQSGLQIVQPGGTLIYGTYGIDITGVGIVHDLTLTQELQITEDEPSPDGKIMGAATHAYKRTISLSLLISPITATLPVVKSVLDLSGAPSHAADYKITSAEQKWERKKGKMFAIEAVWIPPFSS